MKKDGIQTRNRKVTAKSKKRRGADLTSMELFKSFDKPFPTFPPPNITPSMHAQYMNTGGFGHAHSSFMSPGAHAHNASTSDFSCRLSTGYHGPMTSSSFGGTGLGHSFPTSFYGGASSGLDLTNSGIVAGAMA